MRERLRRVRERSYRKFGARMRPGGDLFEAEERFFRIVAARPEDHVEKWLAALACPVFRVDGTRPVEENMEKLCKVIVL